MEFAEAKKKREELRAHPLVVRWMEVFWRSLYKEEGALHHEAYVGLQLRLRKALHKTFNLEEEEESARSEWIHDNHRFVPGAADDMGVLPSSFSMDKQTFMQSLFEVVDIWTVTLDSAE